MHKSSASYGRCSSDGEGCIQSALDIVGYALPRPSCAPHHTGARLLTGQHPSPDAARPGGTLHRMRPLVAGLSAGHKGVSETGQNQLNFYLARGRVP